MDGKPRILIAEDQTLLAEGLKKLIEPEFPAVEIVGNEQTLLQAVAKFKPAIVLIEIRQPTLNGIETACQLRQVASAAKIIIVTEHDEPEYVLEAFRVGATGYILKRCAVPELLLAIRQVLAGKSYVTPMIAKRVGFGAREANHLKNPTTLTVRQREVLQLVAEGLTAKEIANLLQLSVKTAVFHKMAIMDKLGLRTTAELTRYAIEHGIAVGSTPRTLYMTAS